MDNIEEKLKGIMDKMDIGALTEKMKAMGAKMPDLGQMKSMLDEHNKIFKPLSQKNIKFNDKSITAGLTSDNRVTLTFSNMEDAKEFYNEISEIEKKETILTKIKKVFTK